MNPLIHLKKGTRSFVVPFVLTWFALSPQARAVCQQGCDSSLFSAFLGDDALINNTTGAGNTGLGYRSLFLNTAGKFNTGVGVERWPSTMLIPTPLLALERCCSTLMA